MELRWRLWFEKDGMHVMGKGGAKILKAIEKHGSISKACKELGMSYRFVWNYLKRMEEALGDAVVEKKRWDQKRRNQTHDIGQRASKDLRKDGRTI